MITWQLIAKDLQNFISRSLGGCFEVRGFPTSWKGDLSCPWWLMMWHVEPDQTDSSIPTVSKTHVSTTFRYILEERWRFAALLHVKFRFDKSWISFSGDTSLRLGPEIWRGWHGLTIKDTKCTIPVPSQSKLADVTISSAIVSVECMNDSIDISDPPTSNKTKCKKRNCCVLYIPSQSSVIITCNRWSINMLRGKAGGLALVVAAGMPIGQEGDSWVRGMNWMPRTRNKSTSQRWVIHLDICSICRLYFLFIWCIFDVLCDMKHWSKGFGVNA